MNLIDKAIAYLSPSSGIKRMQARKAFNLLEKRGFEAAAQGRRTVDWRSTGASANQEIHSALTWLRQRARDLVRNTPYGKNIVRVIPNNVVGTGILPTPKYEGRNKKVVAMLKAQWKAWADKLHCDFDEQQNFYGMQHLVMKAVVESGECLIRKVRTENKAMPLELQILEGDYIDTLKHDATANMTNASSDGKEGVPAGRDYYGIRLNMKGKKIGYWIYKNHPVEFGMGESVFIPAADIIHVFEVERPGQIRGIPFSASSMLTIRDLDKYADAELIRQQIAACFTVFITEDGDEAGTEKADPQLEKVEPGIIEHLPPGKEVSFATPPMVQGYEQYTRNVLRSISAGNGVSYESMTNDYSNVNFSSGRMGWLEMQRNIAHWQWNMLIPKMCDRVYDWFLETCFLKGYISLENMQEISVTWTPPRREMIDPVKESKALVEMCRAHFMSWQDVVKQLGYIPDELLAELKEDAKNFDTAKLKPYSDPRYDVGNIPKPELPPETD